MLELETSSGTRRSVRLAWRGPPPHLVARALITLFFLPFLLAPLAMLSGSADPQAAEPSVGQRAAVLLMLGTWYALLLGFIWFCGVVAETCTELNFHAERREFDARFVGRLIWGSRRVQARFHDLTRVELQVPAEQPGRNLPLTCRVGWRDAQGADREAAVPVQVAGLDRRGEAVALAIRIAGALGWPAYRVERSDHLRLELHLLRDARTAADALPIPSDGHALEPAGDDPKGLGELVPEARLPAFDPSAFPGPAQVREWQPGSRVRLVEPPAPRRSVAAVVGFLAVVSSVPIIALVVFGELIPMGHLLWIPAVQTPVFAGLVGWAVLRRARREREVVLDWAQGELRVSQSGRQAVHPLHEIDGLRARLRSATERSTAGGRTTTTTVYWAEVAAVVQGREVPLAETSRDRSGPDAGYLAAAPLARELADALGVPWDWEG